MRAQAYRLFEIVAWPAMAWSLAELALRGLTGYAHGAGDTALIAACALLTIAACRWRSRSLAP